MEAWESGLIHLGANEEAVTGPCVQITPLPPIYGDMTERLMVLRWKRSGCNSPVGSNPTVTGFMESQTAAAGSPGLNPGGAFGPGVSTQALRFWRVNLPRRRHRVESGWHRKVFGAEPRLSAMGV